MNNKQFWKNIWDKKGSDDNFDLLYLDGYEHLKIDFSSKEICKKIISLANIQPSDSILEVACGAGFLARELQSYSYVGVDYSSSLIKKHKILFPDHLVSVGEANKLDYDDESHDVVFCFGLFQYLPDREYAEQVIYEMTRVAKKGVFLGDLKTKKTRDEHFVYPASLLEEKGFTISQCVYDANDVERFNAFREKGNTHDLE